MDKKEENKIEFESIIFIAMNNEYRHILKQRKKKQYNFTKQNIEIMAFTNGKKNNKKITYSSKFLNYKRYKLFKRFERFVLIYTILLFLLSLNGVLCQSHIILKINKVGRFKILYNGGVEDSSHACYTVPNHTPTRMTINENENEIDTSTREYDFTQQENTIKIYYEDSKDDFKCLFYGCSDIDEIDASNLITSNVNHMEYMFHGCNSLTSLILSNFNTQGVTSMRSMFGLCSSLTSIDVSSFITSSLIDMANMFEGCSKLSSINLSN